MSSVRPVDLIPFPGHDPEKVLPKVITTQVISFLGAGELAACCDVNRTWKQLASDQTHWKQLFPTLRVPPGMNVQQLIARCGVKSLKVFAQRLHKFAERVPMWQKADLFVNSR